MRVLFLSALILLHEVAFPQAKRAIRPEDFYRIQSIRDPRISPDGGWISYTLAQVDSARDKTISHVWMVSWDGRSTLPLTNGEEGDADARWSPDGRSVAFTSSRHEETGNQLWLLDRRGGEGQKLLELKASIESFAWSPDARKMLLALKDPDYSDTAKSKTRKPWVMDRTQFKDDEGGYLDRRQTHLYLFDIATKKIDTLTRGDRSETAPAWSHDGTRILFAGNRSEDPDLTPNNDLWVMNATPGAEPKRLTDWKGEESDACWSYDDKHIAFLQTSVEDAYPMYSHKILWVMNADGSGKRSLSGSLDRGISNPVWARDNASVAGLVTDDRRRYPVLFSLKDGAQKKLAGGDAVYSDLAVRPDGKWLALRSDPQTPFELYDLTAPDMRRITHVQDSFLAPLQLSRVEGFESASADGNRTGGLLYLPPGLAEKNLPTIFYIHGGPVGQDEFEFDITRQMLSAAGFAVAAVNYRGSDGRGDAFTRSIYADWGNKEIADILGAVDYLTGKGIADSTRLGMAGWSYGGILTDYMMASTTRFKAASSGAGSGLQLSMYGGDEYISQYVMELGQPWTHPDKWIALSYPFFHADRIHTPVLFMACQADFNVPVIGAEQMYQALRTLGVPAQLVIYPGQHHGITTPSYKVDRVNRWVGWFRKYLGG